MPDDRTPIELAESSGEQIRSWMIDLKYLALGAISGPLLKAAGDDLDVGSVRDFCMFVGHGRSGGTLVGALLNAHPNAMISNELNALRRISQGLGDRNLYRLIYLVCRRQARRGSPGGGGYSYAVPGQSQGRSGRLLVIGDRKAGATAYEISRNPRLLDRFDHAIQLRKRFIHVARNPFDTIATTYHKTGLGTRASPKGHLRREIDNYFARCEIVRLIVNRYGQEATFFVANEAVIRDPTSELVRLCAFLEIEPFTDYLEACAAVVRQEPNPTRRSIDWTSEEIEHVQQRMSEFPWLKGYTFDL